MRSVPITEAGPAAADVNRRPDDELAAAAGAGDHAALGQLYDRHAAACYGLARRLLVDPQLAEDVIQDVFLTVWRRGGHDPARGTVATWLLTITHHRAVDIVRRENRRRSRIVDSAELPDLTPAEPPDEAVWARLRAGHVRHAVAGLTAEQREVVLLAYYGGYTQREIAAMTGLPLGTVKTRTRAAMQKLAAALSGDAVDAGSST